MLFEVRSDSLLYAASVFLPTTLTSGAVGMGEWGLTVRSYQSVFTQSGS